MTAPSVGDELAFNSVKDTNCSEQYDTAITSIYWIPMIDTICGLQDCVQVDHKIFSTSKDIY